MQFRLDLRNKIFTTWPVAGAALLGLLVLVGTSILTTSRRAEEIYSEIESVNNQHRDVEVMLRRLRGDVQLSGIYIRDYLLDADATHAPEYRARLTQLRQENTATIAQLRRHVPPSAWPQIDTLRVRLDDYWEAFDPLFDWTIYEKVVHAVRFLRKEVLPRREAVLAITRDIETLNDSNLADQRADVAKREAEFKNDLHRQMWHSLLLGFVVAVAAVLRLRILEHRSFEQRVRTENAEREMRLLSQQLVAAQEEERKKLTRELHDHVGQMLTALRMEIGRAIRARGSGDDPRVTDALSEAKRLLDTILRSVRDLVMGLRPSMLDDFGLQPALEWHVRDFRRRFNIAVDLNVHGDLNALPDQYRTCVYRIVQEALTNAARHAQAKRIEIEVHHDENMLDLAIADDGVGIDTRRSRGMGLIGIEERVRELHGVFSVARRQPAGTELHATIPMPPETEGLQLARLAG